MNILDSDAHGGTRLGEFSASSVTGLIAFELKTNHPDVSARFVLNVPVTYKDENEDRECPEEIFEELSNDIAIYDFHTTKADD